MANSVHQDRQGPVWPLGNIAVVTPGTYVSIMSLVDSTSLAAPETPTTYGGQVPEYTNRAWSIIFMPYHAGAAPPKLAANSGNVYIVKKPLAGDGGVGDVGTVIACLRPTDPPFVLTAAAMDRNIYNLYEYFIDADTATDGCQVTALIAG
jgi:hypothetical protein